MPSVTAVNGLRIVKPGNFCQDASPQSNELSHAWMLERLITESGARRAMFTRPSRLTFERREARIKTGYGRTPVLFEKVVQPLCSMFTIEHMVLGESVDFHAILAFPRIESAP